MAYYKQSYKEIFGTKPKVTRRLEFNSPNYYYKTIILEKIVEHDNPNNRHIREWLKDLSMSDSFIKMLLKDLVDEGLIKIEMIDDRGKIRRYLRLL